MRKVVLLLLAALVSIGGYAGYRYWRPAGETLIPGELKSLVPSLAPPTSPSQPQTISITVIAEGLEVPWSLAFASDNRLLVTERPGRIRAIEKGQLLAKPLLTFSEVSTRSEEGLMGLALHPQYALNKLFYVCLAYESGGQMLDKVVQVKDQGTTATVEKTIFDHIPAAQFHAGCRLQFGPDQKLYVTTGDATDKALAQQQNSLAGKILRLNDDGTIPNDNPIANSAIYSYGHRNPQGLAWHPDTKALYSTEHGPSGFDGAGGGDEVNLIQPGSNYGWPVVSHDKSQTGMVSPLIQYTPAVAPASAMIYSGSLFPDWKNNLFFGGLRGTGLYRVILSADGQQVIAHEKLKEVDVGRVREVVQGPDGAIYFTTSNRDGRGTVRDGDDKVYKLHAD